MRVEKLLDIIDSDFYTGVPDSQLKPLCDYLIDKYGNNNIKHIIGANEGNCVALAAGYHLATGGIPVIYMQNSGEGNIINPVTSLLNDKVYSIPAIFIVGWRGEPGVSDEPQHIFQGEITQNLLEDIEIEFFVIRESTSDSELESIMTHYRTVLAEGKSVAFLICKNALTYDNEGHYVNDHSISRETIIQHIVRFSGENPIICTTGKAGRELFETRTQNEQSHKYDFLTVGSMGHCSSIALGVAINKPNSKIWCVDGDGAVLMHMGALAVIGAYKPQNLIHIVINNASHETVGGMPTVADKIELTSIAKGCGYEYIEQVEDIEELDTILEFATQVKGLIFIEIKCAIGARSDLGRPTIPSIESKKHFMEYLNEI